MSSLDGKKIVVVVAGGIAAYKSADLVSRLCRVGAQARVAMTDAARRFVAPLTFETLSGNPVYADLFERPDAWQVEHIAWARWADAVVVAPATANLMAKMALGLADDAASTLLLTCTGPGAVWIAPSMNTSMLCNPATVANIETLRGRGVGIIEPDAGRLACGEVGSGRMAEPEEIVQVLTDHFAFTEAAQPLAGKTVLITAGPTREALDPIRFLSNRSSGRMGVALAVEARARGARVLLVHGPLAVHMPKDVEKIPVASAREMLAAVQECWEEVDIAVFAAAVANYESAEQSPGKIQGGETLTLQLTRTPDIARWAGENRRPDQVLVGFCAESKDLIEAAEAKLRNKRLDLICANPIGTPGVGFDAEQNQIALLDRDGGRSDSPQADKIVIADWSWDGIQSWNPK